MGGRWPRQGAANAASSLPFRARDAGAALPSPSPLRWREGELGRFRGTKITGDILENKQEHMHAFAMVREAIGRNPSSCVATAVFDNRIEIHSIGDFPTDIRAELLTQEHRSMPRNPLIAGAFHRKFRQQVVAPLLEAGLLVMTISDKRRSSKQRYRITEAGRTALVTARHA
jgi:hypothetical protein